MSEIAHLQSILGNLERAGLYHLPRIDKGLLAQAAAAADLAVFRVDLAEAVDKAGMLTAIHRVLVFPDWFGHNFDALFDCLTDMSWRPAEGYLIMLERCDGIHGLAEEDFLTALDVFERAAGEWREQGVPFWCLVEMQSDGIAWLPDSN